MKRFQLFHQIAALLLCSCVSFTLFASTTSSIKTRKSALNNVLDQIQNIKKDLFHAQSKYKTTQKALQDTEVSIGKLINVIRDTENNLAAQKKKLHTVQRQKLAYQHQLDKQRKLLATQLRSAYMLGHQPYFKLLLNQENPAKFSRSLQYYRYVNQARLDVIKSVKQLSIKIDQTAKNIQQRTTTLSQTYQKQQEQKLSLRQEEKAREQLLHKTHRTIQSKNTKLKQLYENKKQLEGIIKKLIEAQKTGYAPGTTFQQMRGKLVWPAIGRIEQSFGQSLSAGRLHSTGLLIHAQEGKPVHAVFPGKVVFADWLRGFGLLAIIKHGANYLTLYGRNQSLFIKPNQTVKAGQVIASVGNSGGFNRNALYFEIRYKGNPINPTPWLRRLS